MVLILNNKDLDSVLDMPSCVEALYRGLKAFSQGDAVRRPRVDLFAPTSRPEEFACFSSMDGVIRDGYYAIRIKPDIRSWPVIAGFTRSVSYCTQPGSYGGLVLLFRTDNAEPLAIMNDGFLQHMRVGATAALGARYLSRSDASVVGILGSGGMARTFAAGFAAVRKIKKIKAYSTNRERLENYCKEMTEKLGIDVIPQGSAEETVRGSEIVATCTDSRDPVVKGEWLEPGMFVANVKSIELDEAAFGRISLVGYLIFDQDPLKLGGFSDRDFEIRYEVMAYLAGRPEERQKIPHSKPKGLGFPAARWVPCLDWKTEKTIGRQSDKDISFLAELAGSNFAGGLASSGIQGIQFAAVGGKAYELAAAKGLGVKLDTSLFLQDIRT